MTTTSFDIPAGLLTSDSRWSALHGHLLAYVDEDIGFDKIETANGLALLFAGDSGVIDLWKQWLRSGTGTTQMPSPQGIALLVVKIPEGTILAHHGQEIVVHDGQPASVHAVFAGTGAFHAATCWHTNRCGRRAIVSAKLADMFTGGTVKFYELATGANNVANTISAADLRQLLLERGMVMYLNGQSPAVPFKQAAANDVEVAELANKIASGQVTPSAPCDAMFMKATPEQIEELRAALTPYFGK